MRKPDWKAIIFLVWLLTLFSMTFLAAWTNYLWAWIVWGLVFAPLLWIAGHSFCDILFPKVDKDGK